MKIWLFHDWVQAVDTGASIVAAHSLRADVFLHSLSTLLDQAILSTTTNHQAWLGFVSNDCMDRNQHGDFRLESISSVLTSCSIQAAARILTTRLGLIRTSSRYRDPNTTCRATQTHTHTHKTLKFCQKNTRTNKHSRLLPSATEALSPSVSMFWSGISKLISIMLDSFQEPLNMLEKYPDWKMYSAEREKREQERGLSDSHDLPPW